MMQPVHLIPEEAVQAGLDAGRQRLLGIHYGTFDLTDEPLGEPPRRFHAAAAQRGIDDAVSGPRRSARSAPGEVPVDVASDA